MNRQEMIAYIAGVGGYATGSPSTRDSSPLAWNVKVSVDTSLDHMMEVAKKYEMLPAGVADIRVAWEAYKALCQEAFYPDDDGCSRELWDWALEDCRSTALEFTDCLNTLEDGTVLDVEWMFVGRQGGYLAIKRFEGWDFENVSSGELEEQMTFDISEEDDEDREWSTGNIRKLYLLCKRMEGMLTPEEATAAVEYSAAGSMVNSHEVEGKWTQDYRTYALIRDAAVWANEMLDGLDDAVRRAAAHEATRINNRGTDAQVKWLERVQFDAESLATILGLKLPSWVTEDQ